jgi:hypothetical protein
MCLSEDKFGRVDLLIFIVCACEGSSLDVRVKLCYNVVKHNYSNLAKFWMPYVPFFQKPPFPILFNSKSRHENHINYASLFNMVNIPKTTY